MSRDGGYRLRPDEELLLVLLLHTGRYMVATKKLQLCDDRLVRGWSARLHTVPCERSVLMMEAQGIPPVSGARRRRRLVHSHRPRTPLPLRAPGCSSDSMFVAASRKTDATAHGAKAFCGGDDSLEAVPGNAGVTAEISVACAQDCAGCLHPAEGVVASSVRHCPALRASMIATPPERLH